MKRLLLLKLLHNYKAFDLQEEQFRGEMINFIQNNADCFERTLEKGHITASCWLVNNDNSKFLLTHHAKLNAWFQLGGHCDGDPDVLAVALKEAREESGIMHIMPLSYDIFDIDIHQIPENKKDKAHYHYDVRFILQVYSDQEFKINEESNALAWIKKDFEMLPTTTPSLIRMFNKWLLF